MNTTASCIEIDVSTNIQSSHLLSRIIWQHLFNLYRENGGDLSKLDSLLCDLGTLKRHLNDCLGTLSDTNNSIHLHWSFDLCGLTWINTQYCPEYDFNYWIDWNGNQDTPIKISKI